MMSVVKYLDLCKSRTQTESDSNLARKVDITRAAIAAYRKGSSFPSDDNMLRLANRAKLDATESLLLLNIWRSEGDVKQIYQSLLLQNYPESIFVA